eukprot:2311515-Pleurochrysis_carterae.AAC.1
MHTSGNWVQDAQRAELELSVHRNIEWNEWLWEDIQSRPEGPKHAAVWERTIKECDDGLIDGPWTFGDMEAVFGRG